MQRADVGTLAIVLLQGGEPFGRAAEPAADGLRPPSGQRPPAPPWPCRAAISEPAADPRCCWTAAGSPASARCCRECRCRPSASLSTRWRIRQPMCRQGAHSVQRRLAQKQRAIPRSDGRTTGTGRKPSAVQHQSTAPPSVDRPDNPNSSAQHVGISTALISPIAMIRQARARVRHPDALPSRFPQRRVNARSSSSSSWRASSSSMIGMPSRIG